MILLTLLSKSATTAMLLTTFIPGGGQFYTKRWLKGIIIGGTQSYIIYRGLETQFELNDVEKQLQESYSESMHDKREDLIVQRREIIWLGALIWTIGVLDAYVDAQLYDFESNVALNFRGDPKLTISLNIHF